MGRMQLFMLMLSVMVAFYAEKKGIDVFWVWLFPIAVIANILGSLDRKIRQLERDILSFKKEKF